MEINAHEKKKKRNIVAIARKKILFEVLQHT